MLETIKNCLVCQCDSERFCPFLQCKDYTVSKETFKIDQCEACGFKFTNPRPDEASVGKYYQSEDYISHSNTQKGLLAKIYQFVRKKALKRKLNLINQFNKDTNSKKILDYGCGTGHFLEICQQNNWQIHGVEPDAGARTFAQNITKIEIQTSIFDEFYDAKQFDSITLWHVLEHVHQINPTLARLKDLLKDNGTILIAVPNCNAWDAQHYGEFWAAYDLPRHLYHFTPETLRPLLRKHNLIIESYLPMYYDAYYISLLSEKYKTGKMNYLKAFLNGRKSNAWAKKNRNNYSSVIYVVKKLV